MTKVKAELKDYFSPDVFDLRNPGIPENEPFRILFQAMFGPKGEEGQESFGMLVCNPKWIEQRAKEGIFSGRHYLIVAEFKIEEILRVLRELADKCVGADWNEVATKLSRFGQWEFEDYNQGPHLTID